MKVSIVSSDLKRQWIVSRLLGLSGVGDAVESVKTAASDDIQEKMFLDGCLMWHYAAV